LAVEADPGLATGYLLLILPPGILLLRGVPMLRDTGIAVLRMTVQLLFVGLYLQVFFKLNHPGIKSVRRTQCSFDIAGGPHIKPT